MLAWSLHQAKEKKTRESVPRVG